MLKQFHAQLPIFLFNYRHEAVLHERLTVAQLVKKFFAFYGTFMFTSLFASSSVVSDITIATALRRFISGPELLLTPPRVEIMHGL
jgi:hypothetical protein